MRVDTAKAGAVISNAAAMPIPEAAAAFVAVVGGTCMATSSRQLDRINSALVGLVVVSFLVCSPADGTAAVMSPSRALLWQTPLATSLGCVAGAPGSSRARYAARGPAGSALGSCACNPTNHRPGFRVPGEPPGSLPSKALPSFLSTRSIRYSSAAHQHLDICV